MFFVVVETERRPMIIYNTTVLSTGNIHGSFFELMVANMRKPNLRISNRQRETVFK